MNMNDFDDDDYLYDMYNASFASLKKPFSHPNDSIKATDKKTSRVIGGMKAAGVHSVSVEINGQSYSVPRYEYVKILEQDLKETRNKVRQLEDKISRMSRNYNKLVEVIRKMQRDLNNKLDAR